MLKVFFVSLSDLVMLIDDKLEKLSAGEMQKTDLCQEELRLCENTYLNGYFKVKFNTLIRRAIIF